MQLGMYLAGAQPYSRCGATFEECRTALLLLAELLHLSLHLFRSRLIPLTTSFAAPSSLKALPSPNMLSLAVLALAVASPAVAQLSVMRATSELPLDSTRLICYTY